MAIFSKPFGKSSKCDLCGDKVKNTEKLHELRLKVEDGLIEYKICEPCAAVIDATAQVLQKKREED